MSREILVVNHLQVSRSYGFSVTIEDFRVSQGEILVLLGPNGSGKTTLLLAIAHLIQADSADITFTGDPNLWSDPLRLRRQIAMVLQEPLLVDGTVWDNVTLGLRFRGVPKPQLAERAQIWMKRLGISHIAHRKAHTLSGGEARRTSLARALALEPRLLLMDEPFSGLDPLTRASLLDELRPILHDSDVTALLVTHDSNEAMALGDRIAVMLNGSIRQIGTPEEVFTTPVDTEVAELVGTVNMLPGYVLGTTDGLLQVRVGPVTFESLAAASSGEAVFLLVRPEAITLWKGSEIPLHSTARNWVTGRVNALRPQGPHVKVSVDCGGFTLTALITRPSANALALDLGDRITATFKATDTHIVRR